MATVYYNENDEESIYDNYLLCVESLIFQMPRSYTAIKSRDDKHLQENAIKEEINSFSKKKKKIPGLWYQNQTIEILSIVSEYVSTVKNDEFGKPWKFKVRLVARGFSQKYLIDYNETFALVARIASFRYQLQRMNLICLFTIWM